MASLTTVAGILFNPDRSLARKAYVVVYLVEGVTNRTRVNTFVTATDGSFRIILAPTDLNTMYEVYVKVGDQAWKGLWTVPNLTFADFNTVSRQTEYLTLTQYAEAIGDDAFNPVDEQPFVSTPGPKGDQGSTGPQGIQGFPGPMGIPGPTGPTGRTGPTGPRGTQGETGERGPQGIAGSTGPTGPKGDQGERGLPGGLSVLPYTDEFTVTSNGQTRFTLSHQPYGLTPLRASTNTSRVPGDYVYAVGSQLIYAGPPLIVGQKLFIDYYIPHP